MATATRTVDQWWQWHDADSSRWSEDTDKAEARCAAWVAGESHDGPEDISSAAAAMGRKGGAAKTAKQTDARRKNAQKAGRKPRAWWRREEYYQCDISETATGWRVNTWRQVQGELTDESYIVSYTDLLPRGANLHERWNAIFSKGDYLADPEHYRTGRCIRRGHVVV